MFGYDGARSKASPDLRLAIVYFPLKTQYQFQENHQKAQDTLAGRAGFQQTDTADLKGRVSQHSHHACATCFQYGSCFTSRQFLLPGGGTSGIGFEVAKAFAESFCLLSFSAFLSVLVDAPTCVTRGGMLSQRRCARESSLDERTGCVTCLLSSPVRRFSRNSRL
jgi:hypothetical protein